MGSSEQDTSKDNSYLRVWMIAWPIILANSAVPLLGLVDTAVIGHTGRAVDLGAIALGAIIFNFVLCSAIILHPRICRTQADRCVHPNYYAPYLTAMARELGAELLFSYTNATNVINAYAKRIFCG